MYFGRRIFLIYVITMFFQPLLPVFAEGLPAELSAEAAIVIEASTGKVLYEKNADRRENPASTTKMTTLLLALENCNLNDTVTVSAAAAGTEGSSIHLAEGDQIKLRELLQGMMLASGNDATVAVADYMAGSVPDFAEQMNVFARSVGAQNTHFANSSGLTLPDHYTTARDLSKIAAHGYRNAAFRRMVGTKEKEIHWQRPADKKFVFENTNELLGRYRGANGMKTGYTQAAGECLVASAERDSVNLIAVILHAGDGQRFVEAAKLLDFGFSQVHMEKAYSRNELVREVRVHDGAGYKITVRPSQDIYYPVTNGDAARYAVRFAVPRYVEAPVKAGDPVGAMEILCDGEVVDRMPMVADAAIGRGFSLLSFFAKIYDGIFDGLQAA